MAKLKDLDAKLWRASPETYKHMTVFGHQELTKFTCKVCGEDGYLAEAYIESKTKRKHDSHIRPYHARCYIDTNGKHVKPLEKSTASLFEFLKD
jgi:hypothetical protein